MIRKKKMVCKGEPSGKSPVKKVRYLSPVLVGKRKKSKKIITQKMRIISQTETLTSDIIRNQLVSK